ncbi:MAG: BREX-2 system phosphatase PglZ, partial [Verrucomicrobiae bacterium]|nr:BREX-2 system phosphatase PglZ [Verrucomicrobiae bacterium]
DLAYAFGFSKQGFRDRWLRFAEDIDRLAKRKWETGSRSVYNSLSQLRDHGLAPLHESRLKRAEMAARLAAYEANEPVATDGRGSLVKAAASFAAIDSFVDWARFNLAWGDSQPEVAEVYGRLARRRAKVRIEEQIALGDRLRLWHADNEKGSTGLVPIENAVETWVAPLAEQHPVLLLVMDGMSYPAFHQLSRSFVGSGWLPQQKDGQAFPSSVLSVLPSVTERSRWALFSGKIETGSRKGEEVAFREHPALSDLRSRGKPLLFKKGDLGSEDSAALSPKVRDILAGNEHRVVAVVINAIDDQLKTSGQLSVDWAIHHIGILPSILEAADQGDRLIVLTSDHGHIPEMENTKPIETSSDGEARFRFGEPSDENERLFTGKRIEAATGGRPVVLPLTETIRYGSKSAGYHGG